MEPSYRPPEIHQRPDRLDLQSYNSAQISILVITPLLPRSGGSIYVQKASLVYVRWSKLSTLGISVSIIKLVKMRLFSIFFACQSA